MTRDFYLFVWMCSKQFGDKFEAQKKFFMKCLFFVFTHKVVYLYLYLSSLILGCVGVLFCIFMAARKEAAHSVEPTEKSQIRVNKQIQVYLID